MTQRVHEQIRILPPIESKTHLIEVGGEMFGADPMPRSDDAALEQRKCGFRGICVNVSVNVDFRFVINGLVAISKGRITEGGRIGVQFVRHNHVYILAHRLPNILRQRSSLHVLGIKKAEIAAPLPNADHNLLFAISESRLALGPVLLRSDVGLVHFDSTVHQGPVCLFHGSTNPMAQIPRGFVAHPHSSLDLIRGDSFPRFAEKQCHQEPFLQRKMRVVKDRARGYGELVFAVGAPKQLRVRRKAHNFVSLAARAFRAARPAQPFKEFAAFFIGREAVGQFRESHCAHSI